MLNVLPPIDPVVCGDGVIAAVRLRQRLHPDGVRIGVDASVADHQLDPDDVAHQGTVVLLDQTAIDATRDGTLHERHPLLFPHHLWRYEDIAKQLSTWLNANGAPRGYTKACALCIQ